MLDHAGFLDDKHKSKRIKSWIHIQLTKYSADPERLDTAEFSSAINIKPFSMRGWTKGLRGLKFTLYQKGLKFAYLQSCRYPHHPRTDYVRVQQD